LGKKNTDDSNFRTDLLPCVNAIEDTFNVTQDEQATAIPNLAEEQLAAGPQIAMRRMAFKFLLHQEYFGTGAR